MTDKPTPKRMHSQDLAAVLAQYPRPAERIPVTLAKQTFTTFVQIEKYLAEYHSHPTDLVVNAVEVLGLPQTTINELTAKMFEFLGMFATIDDDSDNVFHVSMRSEEAHV